MPEQTNSPSLIDPESLEAEISMLRGLLRAVREMAEGELDLRSRDTRDLLRLLTALSRTATHLAALLKTQRSLHGRGGCRAAPLTVALDGILRDIEEG